jgi:hypothetical protein
VHRQAIPEPSVQDVVRITAFAIPPNVDIKSAYRSPPPLVIDQRPWYELVRKPDFFAKTLA